MTANIVKSTSVDNMKRLFFGDESERACLVRAGSSQVVEENLSVLEGSSLVGLYFSSSWCLPCHDFTPTLAAVHAEVNKFQPSNSSDYNSLKIGPDGARGDSTIRFDVVVFSGDASEEQYLKYVSTLPVGWFALKFEESSIRDRVGAHFRVKGMPKLILVDPRGDLISSEGIQLVSRSTMTSIMPRDPPAPYFLKSVERVLSDSSRRI